MGRQAEGVLGWMVDRMIRNTVRARFRNVYWVPPAQPLQAPAILVANHHGWHDGYLLYIASERLGLRVLDWIAEFDAFPLFAKVGGLPFPPNDPTRRSATLRKTIRLMNAEKRSLMLFAEAHLHRPPELLQFGKSLEFVADKVPGVQVIPVGLRYDMSLHERPEAIFSFGEPVPPGPDLAVRTRDAVAAELAKIDLLRTQAPQSPYELAILCSGTGDVNERLDMRKMRERWLRRNSGPPAPP